MQEKDIREKLNQELDKMAPDILDKIIATPMEPVKTEKELFGRNKALFKEKGKLRKYAWVPALAVAAACIAILIMVIQPMLLTDPSDVESTNIAFGVTIDVNPSIRIKVNADGTVKNVKAENKDAKKIVQAVNEKITDDTNYNKAIKMVIRQLNKNGYLQKKENGMLVSVISDDKEFGKEKLKEIREQTKEVEKEKDIKCTTVFQVCQKNEEVVKVAEKNNVSVGKATLCMKLAEKEQVSVAKMCKKSIDALVKKAEKSGTASIDDEIIIYDELFSLETESMTLETEAFSEAESIEETSEDCEDVTVFVGETVSEEETEGVEETETIDTLVN